MSKRGHCYGWEFPSKDAYIAAFDPMPSHTPPTLLLQLRQQLQEIGADVGTSAPERRRYRRATQQVHSTPGLLTWHHRCAGLPSTPGHSHRGRYPRVSENCKQVPGAETGVNRCGTGPGPDGTSRGANGWRGPGGSLIRLRRRRGDGLAPRTRVPREPGVDAPRGHRDAGSDLRHAGLALREAGRRYACIDCAHVKDQGMVVKEVGYRLPAGYGYCLQGMGFARRVWVLPAGYGFCPQGYGYCLHAGFSQRPGMVGCPPQSIAKCKSRITWSNGHTFVLKAMQQLHRPGTCWQLGKISLSEVESPV